MHGPATPLLSAERREAILDALSRDGKVVAARLVEELGVSEDTVRRDLRELAAHGLVKRVHGGALAQAALELLAPARVILLDGGTTNLELARRLPAGQECTVLTNSPPIAAAL